MRGRRQVHAVAADRRLADALAVATGDPLLLLEGGTTDQHDRALEWFSAWHRADRVVFDIDVSESMETLRLDTTGSAHGQPEPVTPGTGARPCDPQDAPAATGPGESDLAEARRLLAALSRLLG